MYCQHCGSQIPDQARFCPNCGVSLSGQATQMKPGNSKKLIAVIAILSVTVVVAVVLCLTLLMGGKDASSQLPLSDETRPQPETLAPETTLPETTALPQHGWYQENGNTYYLENGIPLTGLQEIRNDYYYFYEDGTMAKSTTVEYGDDVLEFDRNGHLSCLTLSTVSTSWSEETYHFGNGGQAAIRLISGGVEECRSMTFYLRASGQQGTCFSGKWKLLVRSHGTWENVEDLDFQEPDEYFTIRFDTPMDFDAVTAYPTIQGNATYNVFFDISDVRCRP